VSSAPAAPAGAPNAGAAPVQRPSAAPGEVCPLCGAPLHPEQEWCLNCGAAARTRLAASPNWRAPLVVAAAVAVLSLGVLAAALVKLAGGTEPQSPASTRTITTLGATAPTTTAATVPTITTPTTSTTSTTTTTPGSTTPTKTGTVPGTSGLPSGSREKLRIEELRKRTGISTEKLRKLGLLPANK
jgi:hypothetical protein